MKEVRERDITVNRRAFHDYTITERFEAGLALLGSEVKSLRDNRANPKDAYARFFGEGRLPVPPGAPIMDASLRGRTGFDGGEETRDACRGSCSPRKTSRAA